MKTKLYINWIVMTVLSGAIMILINSCEKDEIYEPPKINTLTVTEVTTNSAISGGNITDDGGADITERGVVWSTTINPTTNNNEGKTTAGSGSGEFISTLSGLLPGTIYHVRAYASNIEGITYGNEQVFTTISEEEEKEQKIVEKMQEVIPDEIIGMFQDHLKNMRQEEGYSEYLDSIEYAMRDLFYAIETSFSLEEYRTTFSNTLANLQNNKKSTGIVCSMRWGYAKSLEITSPEVSGEIWAGFIERPLEEGSGGGVKIIYDFVNLDRQVYYYTYCLLDGYALNAGAQAAISAKVGFTGIYELLTDIRFHGSESGLNKFEGVSLSKNHSISSNKAKLFKINLSLGIGTSSETFTGLNNVDNLGSCPENMMLINNGVKGYSFYGEGSLGVSKAAELFLAYNDEKIAKNLHGIEITYHNYSNKSMTTRRFLRGVRMAVDIISLTPDPYDMVASTLAYNSGIMNFANCNPLPAVGTKPIENISVSSSFSGGYVAYDNNSPIYERGVVWSTFERPTFNNNEGRTSDGSGAGEFTSNITGLLPSTTYYVRAYATNTTGTDYGEQVEFKTLKDSGMISGLIYYLSDESGNDNIYVGELDGDQIINIEQITDYSGNNRIFAYDVCNSTGRILYVVTQDGLRGDLYLLEKIYSNPTLVPNQPSTRIGPLVKWAPDGNSLLFSLGANRYYHNLQTATMNLDGSDYQIIISTNQPMGRACHKNTILWLDEGLYLGVTPQWAAHASDHDLWFRNPSGAFTNLTTTSGIGENHAYMNPGGTTIVFATLDNSGRRGIRHMPKIGGTQTDIIPHSNNQICWPNGWLDEETIIYTYRPNTSETKFDLYLIDIDGNNATNISNMPDINIRDAIIR